MFNEETITVSIFCIVYNHAPFIRQCLEGFLIQKTNFKFEIILHDDCSSDGTTDIVKEFAEKYPDLIVPIIQSVNQYQNGEKNIIATFMYPKARGKYLCICEGDDYWTDSLKLQKQVDYLETHPKCGLVYTNLYELRNTQLIKKKGRLASFDDLMIENSIHTLTAMFRRQDYTDYIKEIEPQKRMWEMGDYPLWLYLAYNYDVAMINDYTSVYRVLTNSASHFGKDELEREFRFAMNAHDIRYYYFQKYHLSELKDKLDIMRHETLLRCKIKCKMNIEEDVSFLRNIRPFRIKDWLIWVLVHLYPFPLTYSILRSLLIRYK
ncbi:MAG: glycosyltransferase [Prevotella sp.]|nr:glycosyltransferase [Prevotella sp.]